MVNTSIIQYNERKTSNSFSPEAFLEFIITETLCDSVVRKYSYFLIKQLEIKDCIWYISNYATNPVIRIIIGDTNDRQSARIKAKLIYG